MRRIPPGLVLGLALAFASGLGFDVMYEWMARDGHLGQWLNSRNGERFELGFMVMSVVGLTLMIAGARELTRRTGSSAALWLTIAFAFVLAGVLAEVVLFRFVIPAFDVRWERAESWHRLVQYARALAWIGVAVSLTVGAVETAAGRILVAPMVIATLLAHPMPWMYRSFARHLHDNAYVSAQLAMLSTVLLLACIDQLAASRLPLPIARREAGWAWQRTGDALLASIVVLLVAVVFLAGGVASGPRSTGLVVLLFAFALVVATGLLVASVLGTATPDGAPRWRLHAAAALLGFACLVHANRLGEAGLFLRNRGGDLDNVLHVLTILPILATTAGVCLLLSAIPSRPAALHAGIVAVLLGVVAIGLQEWGLAHPTRTGLGVIALGALAQLGALAWPATLARAHGRALASEGFPAPLPRAELRR